MAKRRARSETKKKKPRTATRRRGATTGNSRQAPGWLWLAAGLGVGLLIAVLVYLRSEPPTPGSQRAEAPSEEARDVRREQPETPLQPPSVRDMADDADGSAGEESGPRFEFYSMLPELEVVVPDTAVEGDEPEDEGVPEVEADGRYLLQVGSFRSHEQAEQQKASLALLGVTARIEEVDIDSETWHRVRIGPFDELDELNDTRSHLKDHGVDTVLLKRSE